jgi:hypothetical protein
MHVGTISAQREGKWKGDVMSCKMMRNGLEIHSVGDMCSWLFCSGKVIPEGQLAKGFSRFYDAVMDY